MTASAGAGGTISPSGALTLPADTTLTFTITPNSGYEISDVFVDSISQGAITSYTFSNVDSNHTIQAFFSTLPETYTVTASIGSGGTIIPSGTLSVAPDTTVTFKIKPYLGHDISDVLVDDVSQGIITSYTFSNVTENHTISASFDTVTEKVWINYSLPTGTHVYAVAIDSNGNKWFGTEYGVCKYDGTNWTTYTTANGLADNDVRSIAIDEQGNKWFGSYNGGVSKFDDTNWSIYTTTDGLVHNRVRTIAVDSDNTMWFGTWDGLSRFDGTNWTTYNTSSGLVSNAIWAITIDDNNNKWIGTENGVSKFDGTNWTTYYPSSTKRVMDIAVDEEGNVWFAVDEEGGLVKYDGANYTNYGLIHNSSKSLEIDSRGHIWVGTISGINAFDGTNWATYTSANTDGALGTSQHVYDIAIDKEGNKWFELLYKDGVAYYGEPITTTYTITASAVGEGTINPSGDISVSFGSDQTFSMTPNTGYVVTDILVNGSSKGAVSSYTFSDVRSNQIITAYFGLPSYTISTSINDSLGGSISPGGVMSVIKDSTITFTITPNSGYEISDVLVDSISQGAITSYTFSNVDTNHTISASFSLLSSTYTVTASAGTGGSINPSGTLAVPADTTLTFTITPNSGYEIASVLVDGVSQGAISSYTFSSINTNHIISATFSDTGPHFTVNASNTDNNSTIMVPTTATVSIIGDAIESGDEIGIFTPEGLCAGFGVWDGNNLPITVWGDDPDEAGINGFQANETYSFKIWDASAGTEHTAESEFSSGNSYYTVDGMSIISKLVYGSDELDITLQSGWSIISSNVVPNLSNMDNVMSGVEDYVKIMKNGAGEVYWPDFDVNNIGSWSIVEGYQIKMKSTKTLTITGLQADVSAATLNLTTGWNLIGYIPSSSMSCESAFSSITDTIIIVKDGMGKVYWPEYSINQIGDLDVGEGYWMKLTGAVDFVYPSSVSKPAIAKESVIASAEETAADPVYFTFASSTGNNATILIQTSINPQINGADLENGDEIGIYTPAGLCCGAGVWDGTSNLAVTVWGDDSEEDGINGFQAGEAFNFKIWDASADIVYDSVSSAAQSGSLTYSTNGITILSSLNASGTGTIGTAFSISTISNQGIGIPFKIVVTPNSLSDSINILISFNFTGTYPAAAQLFTQTAADTFTITADEAKNDAVISILRESDNTVLGTSNTFTISSLTDSDISAPSNLNAVDSPNDDGGYIKLQFNASANHPGMSGDADDNLPIDYYAIYRNSTDTSFQNAVEWASISAPSLTSPENNTVTVTVGTDGNESNAWYWVCAAKGDYPSGVSGTAVLTKKESSVNRIISPPTGKNIARPINNTNADLLSGANLNGDQIVDIFDIGIILDILDNSSEYDPCMDLNSDGSVDVFDIGRILDKFHQSISKNSLSKNTNIPISTGSYIEASSDNSDEGQLEVSISSSQINEISGYEFNIDYNPDDYEFLGVKDSDIDFENDLNFQYYNGEINGKVVVAGILLDESCNYEDSPARITLLEFKWKGNAVSPISINNIKIIDEKRNYFTQDQFDIKKPVAVPNEFSLQQNYPNPFNPATTIKYQLPVSTHVNLSIYNLLGQEIIQLVDAEKQTGYYKVKWDGRNKFGIPVSTGIYIYRLRTNEQVFTKKMIYLK
ncbi:two-component regulator propeller domain-containing protein [candidate division KSB1 bacterium]